MSQSDKLVALAQSVEDIQFGKFADPFPTEYATRDQVEALAAQIAAFRGSLAQLLQDQFEALRSEIKGGR